MKPHRLPCLHACARHGNRGDLERNYEATDVKPLVSVGVDAVQRHAVESPKIRKALHEDFELLGQNERMSEVSQAETFCQEFNIDLLRMLNELQGKSKWRVCPVTSFTQMSSMRTDACLPQKKPLKVIST